MKSIFLSSVLMGAALLLSPVIGYANATEPLKGLPVQDSGRTKPFDTFARESLEVVYGKSSFEKKPAYEIVMTWLLQPQVWQDKPIFEIKHHLVKRALSLPNDLKYISANELLKNEKLSMLLQELASMRESKEKLDPYGQALQRLENQLFTFREIATGRMIRVVPTLESEAWKSLSELSPEEQADFVNITKVFVQGLDPNAPDSVRTELAKNIETFKDRARASAPDRYIADNKIKAEVHYNGFHPFKWAWAFYLLAVVALTLFWILKQHRLVTAGWVLTSIGILFHLYGFGLRIYLSDRAPVSNMYETVVWVSFGTVLFAMIIEAIYKWRLILTAGAAVGAFCLILTDFAPVVLDDSIQPLEPVLRSNFWLTVHVLTITISYAAFFLAFALGDIGLVMYLRDEKRYEERIRALVMALYRSIQIGVAFLAPGIILGGIWADYSWGRFWGWDPKETWALIALLGYLAILHARLAGLLKNFGMICTAILSFSLIIMAWYGVNFVLGAGLHSYGFGAGGVEYVSGFVALHVLAVIFVAVVRRGRMKQVK
ncbi:MAG: cytochrome c biogenesis protein [Bdellovibrio sp.]